MCHNIWNCASLGVDLWPIGLGASLGFSLCACTHPWPCVHGDAHTAVNAGTRGAQTRLSNLSYCLRGENTSVGMCFYCIAAMPGLVIGGCQLCWALSVSWGRRVEDTQLVVGGRSFTDRASLLCTVLWETFLLKAAVGRAALGLAQPCMAVGRRPGRRGKALPGPSQGCWVGNGKWNLPWPCPPAPNSHPLCPPSSSYICWSSPPAPIHFAGRM